MGGSWVATKTKRVAATVEWEWEWGEEWPEEWVPEAIADVGDDVVRLGALAAVPKNDPLTRSQQFSARVGSISRLAFLLRNELSEFSCQKERTGNADEFGALCICDPPGIIDLICRNHARMTDVRGNV